jgi:hypothetical protein
LAKFKSDVVDYVPLIIIIIIIITKRNYRYSPINTLSFHVHIKVSEMCGWLSLLLPFSVVMKGILSVFLVVF